MNRANLRPARDFGIYLLIVNLLYNIIAYTVFLNLYTSFTGAILLLVFSGFMQVMASLEVRKKNGGVISFKDAFSSVILVFLIGVVPTSLFSFVFYNYIDVEAAEKIKEQTIEAAISMMERFNVPQEAIDQEVEKAMKQDQFSISVIGESLIKSLLGVSVFGFIIAAIVKRKPDQLDINSLES